MRGAFCYLEASQTRIFSGIAMDNPSLISNSLKIADPAQKQSPLFIFMKLRPDTLDFDR